MVEKIGIAVRTMRITKKHRYMMATTKKSSPRLDDADISISLIGVKFGLLLNKKTLS